MKTPNLWEPKIIHFGRRCLDRDARMGDRRQAKMVFRTKIYDQHSGTKPQKAVSWILEALPLAKDKRSSESKGKGKQLSIKRVGWKMVNLVGRETRAHYARLTYNYIRSGLQWPRVPKHGRYPRAGTLESRVQNSFKIWIDTCGFIQNYWVFGHCPSSGILETRKHNVSETASVSVLKWEVEDTYSVAFLRNS
jgi:hypothetical protein